MPRSVQADVAHVKRAADSIPLGGGYSVLEYILVHCAEGASQGTTLHCYRGQTLFRHLNPPLWLTGCGGRLLNLRSRGRIHAATASKMPVSVSMNPG